MSQNSDEAPDPQPASTAQATAFERSTANGHGYREVTPNIVFETMGTARIIDVREPHEYTGELGYIESSYLVPLGEIDEASKAWDHAAPIVLVCRSGGRSARAAEHLAARGFSAVMNMRGGMLLWCDSGLPVGR